MLSCIATKFRYQEKKANPNNTIYISWQGRKSLNSIFHAGCLILGTELPVDGSQ